MNRRAAALLTTVSLSVTPNETGMVVTRNVVLQSLGIHTSVNLSPSCIYFFNTSKLSVLWLQ